MNTERTQPPAIGADDLQLQAYYVRRAPYYEEMYLLPERQADLRLLDECLPRCFEGREVLEVACGTGYWTRRIGRTACRVHATDRASEPLAIAGLTTHLSSVTFSEADALDLPEGLGAFDAAFAGFWFSHVPIARRTAFMNSVHRRLRPGARVVWIDNTAAQQKLFPINERDSDGNTYQTRTLKDGSSHRVLKNFPSAGELTDLVAPMAAVSTYRQMEHFWLFEYEFRPAQGLHSLDCASQRWSGPGREGRTSEQKPSVASLLHHLDITSSLTDGH
jgi:ubiquinone/menaquinone biosynthesis C-methylase UbiE